MKKALSKNSGDWVKILKALSDENRLQIIRMLLNKESSVNQLSDILGIAVCNMSRHLKVLETNGLIKKRKEGVYRFYSVSEKLKFRLSDDCMVLDLGCCKFRFADKNRFIFDLRSISARRNSSGI